jgi:hypothetical protein
MFSEQGEEVPTQGIEPQLVADYEHPVFDKCASGGT